MNQTKLIALTYHSFSSSDRGGIHVNTLQMMSLIGNMDLKCAILVFDVVVMFWRPGPIFTESLKSRKYCLSNQLSAKHKLAEYQSHFVQVCLFVCLLNAKWLNSFWPAGPSIILLWFKLPFVIGKAALKTGYWKEIYVQYSVYVELVYLQVYTWPVLCVKSSEWIIYSERWLSLNYFEMKLCLFVPQTPLTCLIAG